MTSHRHGRVAGHPAALPVLVPVLVPVLASVLVSVLLMLAFALLAVGTPTADAAASAAAGPVTAAAPAMDTPDGSPGVLGLPPNVHVLATRAVDGPVAPSTPLAAAGATTGTPYPGAAGTAVEPHRPPAGEPTTSSWWGRAPPHLTV